MIPYLHESTLPNPSRNSMSFIEENISATTNSLGSIGDRTVSNLINPNANEQIFPSPNRQSNVANILLPSEVLEQDIELLNIENIPLDNKTIFGSSRQDILNGSPDNDTIFGGGGRDILTGSAGDDKIFGGAANDLLTGDQGNDELFGGAGNDRIFGSNGKDQLFGEAGKDSLFGGNGNDELFGGKGNDSIEGGRGRDRLFGGKANDVLNGGKGKDELFGEEGNDILWSYQGGDSVFGGIGRDQFWIAKDGFPDKPSRINDFSIGKDIIGIENVDGIQSVEDLSFEARGRGTIISSSGRELAVLLNISPELLATDLANSFLIISSDSPPPVEINITASLANDTGISELDAVTADATVVGKVDEPLNVEKLLAGFENPPTFNITDSLRENGDFRITNDILTSIKGQPLTDGSQSLHLQVIDKSGNVSAIRQLEFTLDTTAPAAPKSIDLLAVSDSGNSDNDNISNDVTPSVSVQAEAGTTVQVFANDSFAGEITSNGEAVLTLESLNNGNQNLTAQAIDAAGNISAISEPLIVSIDTELPLINITSDLEGTSLSTGARLQGTASDDSGKVSELSYRFDEQEEILLPIGDNSTFDSELDISELSDGAHTLTVTAIDTAGNATVSIFNVSIGVQETGELESAFNLGELTDNLTVNGAVSDSEPVDFYKFTTSALSSVSVDLQGLSTDVDIALIKDLNEDGIIQANEVGALGALEGSESESLELIVKEGEYFVVVEQFEGDTNYDLKINSSEVTIFPDSSEIEVKEVSSTTFNKSDSPVEFEFLGAEITKTPTIRIYHNDELVTDFTVTEQGITIPSLLEEGENEIFVYGVKDQEFVLLESLSLWAGSEEVSAVVIDESGNPVSGAIVTARLADNEDVSVQQFTDAEGRATFSNVPARTILFEAVDGNNNIDAVGDIGSINQVLLTLKGFDSVSTIDNNDFTLGLEGWNIGDAPVTLKEHEEPVFGTSTDSEQISELASFDVQNFAAAATAVLPDIDLVLNTSGEGEQSISRTFQTQPGIECITLEYQFITSEIPGGYFGSEFNDYYNVSIRSQGGGVVQETASMNGLGLSAFTASGETEFRQITLPVDVEGDTVQVDITVANVGDDLFDSQVVIDSIDPSEVDELDYEDLSIEFKGFIPSRAVSLTNKTFSYITPLSIFGGDNRGLGGNGTSRFTQAVTVTADPDSDPTVTQPVRTWGQTTSYNASQGTRVSGRPFWWWTVNPGESPTGAATLPVTTSNNNVTVTRITEDTVKVDFDIDGSNPLQFGAPNLNANLDLFIRQQSPCHQPEYRLGGVLDGFPAYEIFINGESVFGVSPEAIGNTPFELTPFFGDVFLGGQWRSVPE